jgi:carbon storage regulator CsrA
MLVLSRRTFERVRIFGDSGEVWVRVLRIDGDRVSLGFEAPENIAIDREEVALRRKENQDIATTNRGP